MSFLRSLGQMTEIGAAVSAGDLLSFSPRSKCGRVAHTPGALGRAFPASPGSRWCLRSFACGPVPPGSASLVTQTPHN